jgi:hypothetical protein
LGGGRAFRYTRLAGLVFLQAVRWLPSSGYARWQKLQAPLRLVPLQSLPHVPVVLSQTCSFVAHRHTSLFDLALTACP